MMPSRGRGTFIPGDDAKEALPAVRGLADDGEPPMGGVQDEGG